MNLIYSIAYGAEAWHQASVMAQSIRGLGKFDGDLVVFSDTDAGIDGATVIKSDLPLSFYSPKLAKVWFGMTHDFFAYSKVLYLDSDVIAIRPIAPVFELNGSRAPWDGGVSSRIDLERNTAPHFNAGTILSDPHQLRDICTKWWDGLIKTRPTGVWVDQPYFNELIKYNWIQIEPIPYGWVHLFHKHESVNEDTILVHVTYPTKHKAMQALLAVANL